MDKIEKHKQICDRLHGLYVAKNSDYGDSFKTTRDKYKDCILIRLNDKLSRLETLYGSEKIRVKDENIKDTLMDLANYCIMELIEMELDNNQPAKLSM